MREVAWSHGRTAILLWKIRLCGLLTSEPQAGADLSLDSSVVSDCDGTLRRCELLVCTGQEFDGLEGVADTCDGVGLRDTCGTEGVDGMAENLPVCVERQHLPQN